MLAENDDLGSLGGRRECSPKNRAKKGSSRDSADLSSQTFNHQLGTPFLCAIAMALPVYVIRPATRCLRRTKPPDIPTLLSQRTITSTSFPHEEASLTPTPPSAPSPPLDPNTIHTRKEEHLLAARGLLPIGSRRRRAALASTSNIPFEQLPYQCFQEARKILAADREVKLKQIEEERKRIAKVEATDVSKLGGEVSKKGKLVAMHKYLEQLKVLADANDPVIKKRFEDGEGMS